MLLKRRTSLASIPSTGVVEVEAEAEADNPSAGVVEAGAEHDNSCPTPRYVVSTHSSSLSFTLSLLPQQVRP